MPYGNSILNTSLVTNDKDIHDRLNFSIRGNSNQCSRIIKRREHLLIGISPFNSRFSPTYIESLLVWGKENFSCVDVLLPDEESAVVLLLATGIPASKAMRKTRKEIGRHRRILANILNNLGDDYISTRIISFSDYSHDSEYLRLRLSVQEMFELDEKFRMACINMSSQAIRGRAKGIGSSSRNHDSIHSINIAVPYIFSEMPFYLNSASLLGVNSSILGYHREWPIGNALLAGEFPLKVSDKQGHGILSIIAS